MEQNKPASRFVAPGLTIIAALLRLAPHPTNFTPIEGMALFGGARLAGWTAWAIPLAAMLITDPIVSWMAGYPAYSTMTPVIYACLLINVCLGRALLRNSQSAIRIGSVSLLGSTIFFLVTNFFVWVGAPAAIYPHTSAGLIECFVAALPFFSRSIVGNLFYAGVLFAAHAALTRHTDERVVATAKQ